MSTQSWQDFYNPLQSFYNQQFVGAHTSCKSVRTTWQSSFASLLKRKFPDGIKCKRLSKIHHHMWLLQIIFISSQKARSKKLQVCGDYFDIALWFLIDLAQWGCPACCLPTCQALLTCWPLFCSVLVLNRACFSSVFCSYVWHVPAYFLCSIPWYGWLIPSVVFLKVVVLCSALFLE